MYQETPPRNTSYFRIWHIFLWINSDKAERKQNNTAVLQDLHLAEVDSVSFHLWWLKIPSHFPEEQYQVVLLVSKCTLDILHNSFILFHVILLLFSVLALCIWPLHLLLLTEEMIIHYWKLKVNYSSYRTISPSLPWHPQSLTLSICIYPTWYQTSVIPILTDEQWVTKRPAHWRNFTAKRVTDTLPSTKK